MSTVNEGTLGNWVHKYRVEHVDDEPALSVSERALPRELEREGRELRMKTGSWGKRRPSAGMPRPASAPAAIRPVRREPAAGVGGLQPVVLRYRERAGAPARSR